MNFRRKATTLVASAALFGLASASASAATIINYDQNNADNPTGTISYDGNGGALVGSHISFSYINLLNATAPEGHDNSLRCASRCYLDFSTGANQSEGSTYTFDQGGSFTLTGTIIDSMGNTVASSDDGMDLISGYFNGTPTLQKTGANSLIFAASGSDEKSPDLLTYFGIDPGTQFTFSNTEISLGETTFRSNGGFSGSVTAGDINNLAHASDVPEPAEWAMFGLGVMLVAGGLAYRRRQTGAPALMG